MPAIIGAVRAGLRGDAGEAHDAVAFGRIVFPFVR